MRHAGIHAAAVVIADRPLTDIVPVQLMEDRGAPGRPASALQGRHAVLDEADRGDRLLKMDFLGLRNLDVIEDCLSIIEESTGQRPDMATLPLDDPKTYEMMARGDSIGVFQFESDGMREALRKVKPTEFEDLVALNALYRPGDGYIDTYARASTTRPSPGRAPAPDHRGHLLGDPLPGAVDADREVGGRVLRRRADDLRKAIGKKNREAAALTAIALLRGARARHPGRDPGCWAVNEAAATTTTLATPPATACRLPHRLAQGQLPGRVHGRADLLGHVDEGQGALLRRAVRGHGHRGAAAATCNLSGHDFKVVVGNIRFGLDAVKGLGYQAVEAIIARVEGRPFTSVWDFCRRVDCQAVNKKASESLVKCGAMDSLPGTRTGMMRILLNAQASGAQMQQDAQRGQGSFFDLDDGPGAVSEPDLPVPELPDEREQLNEWEKESSARSCEPSAQGRCGRRCASASTLAVRAAVGRRRASPSAA